MMMMMMMTMMIIIIIIIIIIKYHETKYYKQQQIANTDSVNNLMRLEHIIPACPILAKEQYIKRHDRMCAQLHFNTCKETGVKLNRYW